MKWNNLEVLTVFVSKNLTFVSEMESPILTSFNFFALWTRLFWEVMFSTLQLLGWLYCVKCTNFPVDKKRNGARIPPFGWKEI